MWMDPALETAVKTGDLNFLREAAASQHPPPYFLAHCPADKSTSPGGLGGNIFLLAAANNQLEFFEEAMKLLPIDLLKVLLFQVDQREIFGCTPLHAAAIQNSNTYAFVKLILEFYKSLSPSDAAAADGGTLRPVKPWLALIRWNNKTPLHLAMEETKEHDAAEEAAMELLSVDAELHSCLVVDRNGNSPLYYALLNGFDQVAEKILQSPIGCSSFTSEDHLTPFTVSPTRSDNVFRLLLDNYLGMIDKIDNEGLSVVHKWAENGYAWQCKLILESSDLQEARTKIFKHLIFSQQTETGKTPLHMAAKKKESEIGQILLRGYQHLVLNDTTGEIQELVPPSTERYPWRVRTREGDTALHAALYGKHEELALEILSIDPTLTRICNNAGESPFLIAVWAAHERVVEKMLNFEEPRFYMLRNNRGTAVIHYLHRWPEEYGTKLLEKFWWMMKLVEDSKKTALDHAKIENAPWLVKLLENPSLIQKEPFDWIKACKNDEPEAVLAFIDCCSDLQSIYYEKKDTPLHHIKLPTYKAYMDFLEIKSVGELKNTTDRDGKTPLHRALERKDIHLAKALLNDNEVNRSIPDHNGVTAMDLLLQLYKENDEWENMCKQIKVNPQLKISYIRPGTNLDQMRNTLSVVAALLATITFAAGFTLPGGINSDTGKALLAKNAAFLVFLLSDVLAMCTSMFVLFCLIWSMVLETDMSKLLVDRSVYLLMFSLYGTLVAFVAGIFTVIPQSTLWSAIVVLVMCSVVGVTANRTILGYVLARLIPAADKHKPDRARLLEEGNANASATGEDAQTQQSKSLLEKRLSNSESPNSINKSTNAGDIEIM